MSLEFVTKEKLVEQACDLEDKIERLERQIFTLQERIREAKQTFDEIAEACERIKDVK